MKFRHTTTLLLCMLASLVPGVHAAAPHTDPVPVAPSNAALYTYPAPTSIEISWTDNSTDENSFTIERKIDGQPDTSFTPVGSAFAQNVQGTGDTVYFTDTGLTSDTVYDYRVEALASDGTASTFSNTATGTTAPVAPINLSASAVAKTDGSIALTWTDNARHSQYFRIYRSTDGVTFTYDTYTYGTPGQGNAQGYTDTGLNVSTTYYYEVTAQNQAGESARSAPAHATTNAAQTVPAAPYVSGSSGSTGADGKAAPGTTAAVTVYDQSTNETGFTLERQNADASAPTYTPVASYPSAAGTGTQFGPFYDTGLSPDTEYDYKAFATNVLGNSPDSNILKLYTIPATPTITSASAVAKTDGSIALTWTDNARHSQYFRIYRSTDGVTFTYDTYTYGTPGQGNAQGYTDTGLNVSTTYYYEVTAQNQAGESARSAPAHATTNAAQTVPAAPYVSGSSGSTGADGKAAPGTTAAVTVYDQSTNETGFTLERQNADASAPTYTPVASYPSAAGTGTQFGPFYDTGLSPDTEYDYKAFATNSAGNSLDSTVLKLYTLPAVPIGLTASAVAKTDGSIALTWTDNARHAQYFRIYRSTDGVTFTYDTYTYGTPGKGLAQTFTDSNLDSAKTYYYEVTAQNQAGESARSAPAHATTNAAQTVPAAPSVSGSAGSTGADGKADPGTTAYVYVYDASTNETGFTLERQNVDAGTAFAPVASYPSAAGTGTQFGPFYDTGLSPDTEYDYKAFATNVLGNSPDSNILKVYTIPAVPIGLTATALDSADIRLVWTDNARHAQYFRIYRSTDGVNYSYYSYTYGTPGKGNTETFTDSSLTVNTTYYYEVTAQNQAAESVRSAPASATTLPNAAPGAPTDLQGTGTTGPTQVDLNWLDNSNDEFGFIVERQDNDDPTSVFTALPGATAGAPTVGPQAGQGERVYFVDKGVAPDTIYSYQVKATNPVGSSAYTNTVSVVTAPAAPTKLAGHSVSGSSVQITLTWTDNATHETAFNVYHQATGQTGFTQAGSVPASAGTGKTVTFTDTGLTVNTAYNYYVTAVNAGGASAPTSTITVSTSPTDTVPPSTTLLTGPGAGSVVCANAVTFTYTGLDNLTPVASLQYETQLDGGGWSAPSLTTTITLTGLANGPHTFAVRAVDQAGNVDPNPPSRSFTISTAPPTISAVVVSPTGTGATITWTTNKAATSQVQYRVSGTTAWTTITSGSPVTAHSVTLSGLTLGTTYQYQVLGADSCGDTATFPIGTFATANPAPTITGLSPASATAGGTSFTLTITGTGFLPGVSTVTFGGQPVTTLPGATATQLQVTVPASAILNAGSPAVTVTNPAPGGGPATANFLVQPPKANVPPSVTLTAPQDGASQYAPANVTVSATASDSDGTVAQVEFFQNGASIGVVKAAPYTVSVSGLAPGAYVFKAVATDNKNAATTSNTDTVTINLLPLGVTILSGPANNATVCSGTVTFTWAGRITPAPAGPLKFQTQLDGGAWSAASTATQQTLTGLAGGLHSFAIRVLNPDGSVYGSPTGVSFFVNLTSPTLLANTVDARDTRATVNWSTSKPTTGFVEYGLTTGYGQQTAADTNSNGAHQTPVTGLTPLTIYHYRIHYTDGCHPVASPDQTFTTVAVLHPNLEVSGATLPGSFAPLGLINLSWTVLNAGPGDALTPWIDTVYLSTKNTLDATAAKLGDFPSVQPLLDLDSYTQNQSVSIPRVPAGPYYLLIQTNSGNTLPETTTGDNTLAIPVSVTALQDLVVTPSQTNLSLHVHQTVMGQLTLTDLSLNAQTGLTATVVGAPSNLTVTVTPPTSLQSLQSGTVLFSVVAADASTLSASPQIVLKSASGATATTTLNLNVIPPTPQLSVSPATLTSSMVRGGKTRLVNFTVTNSGDATAKGLTLSLPNVPWISLPSDNASGDLAPGASAQLELQLNPAPDLPLGLYTGILGLNGANTAVSIPFAFNCVSTAVGDLKVVAQDEFSFFADTHPNIAGAHVVLTDATTGVVVVDDVTGLDGTLAKTGVTEGNYNLDVTSPGHNPYHGTLHLIAGETNEIDPFLSRQLVTYTWDVVPVTLADQYTVSLEATFETHVPAPVVTVSPATLNLATLNYDSSGKAVVNYTFTNVGLIAAQAVNFSFTSDASFTVTTSLQNVGTIPALTSVVVPVTIQKVGATGSIRTAAARTATPATLSSECGDALAGLGGYSYLCGGLQTHPLYAALINQFLTEPGGCAILNFLEYVQAVNGPIGGPGSDYPIGGSADVNGKIQSPTSITTSGPCSPTQIP